jgi:diguanylate cyclase (GGDEF)-like protein
VVTIVFALAVANLGLGFALAVALDRLSFWSMPSFTELLPDGLDVANSDWEGPTPIDDQWTQKLWDAGVAPMSAMERLLWIVKLETGERRLRLIELDKKFFDVDAPQPIDNELREELELFHQMLVSWIAQADAAKEQTGPSAELIQEGLLDQAFQLRSCIDALAEPGRNDVARQFAAAMTAVNALRDWTDALLCQLLLAEDRLESAPERYLAFGTRKTLTHLGLAALFKTWWGDDPDHVRLVSLVMLDLDRFEPFTQQIGSARGDIALLRFGAMLHDLLRKERGFDRVARLSGQRFVLFLGDTSSKNAAKGAERVRQTIEATSFRLGEATFEVTASLAVIEVGKSEGPSEFMPRLEAVLTASKKAGRNCGYLDSGNGPEPICLPQYQVSVRVIELDE